VKVTRSSAEKKREELYCLTQFKSAAENRDKKVDVIPTLVGLTDISFAFDVCKLFDHRKCVTYGMNVPILKQLH
jgi:hypothetical protein